VEQGCHGPVVNATNHSQASVSAHRPVTRHVLPSTEANILQPEPLSAPPPGTTKYASCIQQQESTGQSEPGGGRPLPHQTATANRAETRGPIDHLAAITVSEIGISGLRKHARTLPDPVEEPSPPEEREHHALVSQGEEVPLNSP
jgi:hypothetical protein